MLSAPRRRTLRVKRNILIGLLLAVFVWFSRSYQADRFVTSDEPAWAYRSARFVAALAEGNWRGTALSGHPGVTTMWLGGLSLWQGQEHSKDLSEALQAAQALADYDPSDAEALRPLVRLLPQAKKGMAVAHAVVALAIWLLLVRLVERRYALAAAGLLFLDPYYLGLSRVLHLDALMSGLMLVALLATMVYTADLRRRWLMVAGLATGLAILTKTTAFILLPCLAALLAIHHLRSERERPGCWRALLQALALWGLSALAIMWVAWPAAWVAPWETLQQILSLSQGYLESAQETTHFFLGRAVNTPNALFYPVALLFRSTPLTLLGSVGACVELGRLRKVTDPASRRHRMVMLSLLAMAMLYLVVISLSAKKYDRYMLPMLLALDVAAAIGLLRVAERRLAWLRAKVSYGVWAAIGVQALALLAPLWPSYALAYYNPLAGGRAAACWALEMGWGEGLEQAVDYLSALPGASESRLATHTVIGATAYPGPISYLSERTVASTDYILLYHTDQQKGGPLVSLLQTEEPLFVAQIAGHPYAWVYANPLNAALRQDVATLRSDGQRILSNFPVSLEPADAARLHIIETTDPDEIVVALTQAAQGANELLYIQMHKEETDGDDPLAALLVQGAPLVERHDETYYSLLRYVLPAVPHFVHARATSATYADYDGQLLLERYGMSSMRLEEGIELGVALRWRAQGAREPYHVSLRLVDDRSYTWGQSDSRLLDEQGREVTLWEPGETYETRHAITLKPGTPPGRYCLVASLYRPEDLGALPVLDAEGRLTGTAHTLGCLRVEPATRAFGPERLEMPQPVHKLLGDGIELLGLEVPSKAESGQRVAIWLCWQCQQAPQERYWASLTLIGKGRIIASGRDHPLGPSHPTDEWQPGESSCYPIEIEIEPGAAAGSYTLMLMLEKADGQPLLAEPLALGDIQIAYRERRFSTPEPRYTVDALYGEQIALLGYDLQPERPALGQPLQVTLYWQALRRPEKGYTVFIHLLDEQGTILAQCDAQPREGSYSTDHWVKGEIVLDTHVLTLPQEAPPSVRLAIGLYDAATGQRLALYDSQGHPVPEDRWIGAPIPITE